MHFSSDHFGGYKSMDTSGFGMNSFGGGGGGFMEEGSPGLDASQSSQLPKNRNTTLFPCTTAILHKAVYNQHQDTFNYQGIEIHQVTVVGVIREVEEAATNIVYKINDMTGPSIVVRKWLDSDENQKERERRSQCRENTYVRVTGNLKFFEEKASIMGFAMVPLTDFNEITYHMLDVIHSFLILTKPKEAPSLGMNVQKAPMSLTNGSRPSSSYSAANDGIGGIERQILNAISACPEEEGINTTELRQRFSNLAESQIRKALDFLSNEGHIYSTVDEDHFKSTAA